MKQEKKMREQEETIFRRDAGATPFDDAFKTEVARLREFLVPLINELYGSEIDASLVEITREANEHYMMADTDEDSTDIPHRLTDSCLRIEGKLYHVECQSTEDGDILLRLVEYNMQIGLENVAYEGADNLVVEMPQSSLLKLRSGTPDGMKRSLSRITYRHNDQEIRMEVPVLHVQAYTPEEIYEKNLYFLIPFYSMRYEKAFDRIARDPLETKEECDKIYRELCAWFQRLEDAYESGEITEDEGRKLAELSRVILNHITRKLAHETAERMVDTVGGKVLELQEDRWLKQGREEGMKQGREEERANTERERMRAEVAAKRADDALKRVDAAEARIRELEAQLAAK